jgi:HlyD family secretion protein
MPRRPSPRCFFLLALLPLLPGCESKPDSFPVVGTLEWERIELIAEKSEPIVETPVKEGDWVEPGQVLVRQDPARWLARLNQNRAEHDRAAANLRELEVGPRAERIAEAEAKFRGADQVAAVRQREYERLKEILNRRLISPDAVDKARAALDAARAERNADAAVLQELRAGTRSEELEQARQTLARTEAELRSAEVDLDRLTLRAPVAGRLDSLPLVVGNHPQVGAVLAVLLSGAAPYARVYIPEPIRARIKPGDPARIRVDGRPEPYAGVVRTVRADPVFTPFFALTERDRHRLSYVAKIDLQGDVRNLPAGVPLQAAFPNLPESPAP